MNRDELIRKMVLSEISDDYENVDQIVFPVVARECAKLGLVVERSDVVGALAELIEQGLAKVYQLSTTPAKELESMPSLEVIEEDFETYFYITKKGMDYHLSDDTWWPFDDQGQPLPGCVEKEEPLMGDP